jgi:hypothetical protein
VLHDWDRRLPGEAMPGGYPSEVMLHALAMWSRLYGVISLQINGVLAWMGIDPRCFSMPR